MVQKRKTALEDRANDGDRLYSPSAGRNRDIIRSVLIEHMPAEGIVLEIGAGTGEHAVHFASSLPHIRWAPGDPDAASRASIAAWITESGLTNLDQPHAIDVSTDRWADYEEESSLAGIVSINMIHIASFAATKGLVAGAGRYLRDGGVLFVYGPFTRGGHHNAPSNKEFDEVLKNRNAQWGIRDLDDDIMPIATEVGLKLETVVEMPKNNLSVVLRK